MCALNMDGNQNSNNVPLYDPDRCYNNGHIYQKKRKKNRAIVLSPLSLCGCQ